MNVTCGLEGQQFREEFKVGFFIKPSLKSFVIRGNGATTTHLPHGFTPTDACPTKNFNGRC